MKLGLISTFYKKSKPFHKECLESIANQSDNDFTAILFGDNFEIDLSKYNFKCHVEYEYLTKLSPRQIKTKGIKNISTSSIIFTSLSCDIELII